MNVHKSILLIILTLVLIGAIGSAANLGLNKILPRVITANAIQCPTGGPTNGCITVSLDVHSFTQTGTSTGCAPSSPLAGQKLVCDTTITATASNTTTFRVGGVLNASVANKATSNLNCGTGLPIQCGVWVWQFGIVYDPTIVTPQGDPSSFCTSYPDCAENTVWYGTQTATSTINWAGFGPTVALHTLTITENPATPHVGEVVVGFSFLAPGGIPAVISARNVLANVAFELVGKGTATFTVADVVFGDANGILIPGITAAPATPCIPGTLATSTCGQVTNTITNDSPHATFTTIHVGTSYTFTSTSTDDGTIANYAWDFGDKTPILSSPTATSATHDYGITGTRSGPGNYTVTLRVTDNLGATGAARDSGGALVVNSQPSHKPVAQIVERGPQPKFTVTPSNPNAGATVTFDATASTYPDEPVLSGTAPIGGTALANTDALAVIGFVDNDANGVFDPGIDTVCRDPTLAGTCTVATSQIMAGPPPTLDGSAIIPDPKTSYVDSDLGGTWDPGEAVIYDTNGNLVYDGVTTYSWDFGDTASGASNTASGVTATHIFNPAATTTFTVTLKATDNLKVSNSTTQNVQITVVAVKHSTATTVTCSSTAFLSQGVTCTATVTDSTPPVSTPTGTVTFAVSGVTGTFTTCNLAAGTTAGTATCDTTFTASTTGSASITGIYPGDTGHNASPQSAAAVVTVNLRTTTTGVTCASPVLISEGSICSATVTDTAAGTVNTPTGTLTLAVTGVTGTFTTCTLALGTTAGTAVCTSTFTASTSGTASIVGTYASSDSVHAGSSNTVTPASVGITKRTTTVSVSCTSPIVVNQGSTCTVTVSDSSTAGLPVTPTGVASFTVSGVIGTFTTCNLLPGTSAGTATCTSTFSASTAGTASIVGRFDGDNPHLGSNNTANPASVTVNLRTTSTSITCLPSTIPAGQPSTCTATVTDTTIAGTVVAPTGTVIFSQTGIAAGALFTGNPCALTAGTTAATATCQVTFSSTNTGTATISATYTSTDTAHSGSSTATSATVAVGGHVTTTSVNCTGLVVINQGSTCTATVTDTSTTGATTPTGSVTFNAAGVTGTFTTCGLLAATTAGTATCTSTFTASAAGPASIVGTYSGDSSHGGSDNTANPASVTVNPRTTAVNVACSPSSIDVGQTTTCTGTVTDSSTAGTAVTPTGTLTFAPTAQCTLTGTGATASCMATEASTPNPGSLFVTVTFAGDASHTGSGPSNAFTVTVKPRTTSTNVSCPASGIVGIAFACTVTVTDTDTGTSSTPTGTFTVNGVTCILAGTGASATCNINLTPTATGPLTVTATYPGDATHATSTGSATVNISQPTAHPTTTTVSCSPTTVVVNQATSCTATVTDTSTTGATTPTGTVTFIPTATCSLSGTGASATCSTSITPSAAGTLTVSTSYGGDSANPAHAGSSSTVSATVTVNLRTTTTAVNCTPNTIAVGQTTSCTVTVTDSSTAGTAITPTRQVTFTTVLSCTLAGTGATATCSVTAGPSTSSGTFVITATYAGDADHSGSTDFTTIGVVVRTTGTTVSCPASGTVGIAFTCTATVTDTDTGTSSTPVGIVNFTPSGTCTLAGTSASATCTVNITPTATGPLTVTANYLGDATVHGTSSGNTTLSISQATAQPTTTTLACNPASIVVGQPSTCTATVTDTSTTGATVPTGMVTFTPGGSCTLQAATTGPSATCSVPVTPTNLAVTTLLVNAVYGGDSSHSGSSSNTVNLTVTARSTTTSISCVPAPVNAGTSTNCTVTVTDTDVGGFIPPLGQVTVMSSGTGTFIGSPCSLSGTTSATTCQVMYTPSGTVQRTDTLTADYASATTHLASSGTFQLSVTQQVATQGHAKLIQWKADAKFNPNDLRQSQTQILRAFGFNDGNVTVKVYVRFIITNPDGTTSTIYTQVVSLSPGQSINGRLDNRFTASFNPLPGRTNVTATIFYSSVSSTIGDISFTPDTASLKTFSFRMLGVRAGDFNFNDDITTTSQSFDASIRNVANVDLVSRVDVTIKQLDRTTTSYASGALLLQSGQEGHIIFIVPLIGPDGTYCFAATVKFGIDANRNGQLDNNEILGTSGTQHDCFFADTDDAPLGVVIALPVTVTHTCSDDD